LFLRQRKPVVTALLEKVEEDVKRPPNKKSPNCGMARDGRFRGKLPGGSGEGVR